MVRMRSRVRPPIVAPRKYPHMREGIFFGTGGKTRTYEGLRREIYSLLSLPLDDSGSGSIHLATNTYRQIVEPLYGFEP